MGQAIKVLDHGYVRFIEASGHGDAGEVELDRHPPHDYFITTPDYECGIIEAARMSTQASFRGWAEDEKLLRTLYMSEPQHATPFEFADMTIEVQAPIFVFREWQRHRTQCLAGTTPLVFESPSDGRAYPKSISDVVRSWYSNPFNRNRIRNMILRGAGEKVSITDAWHSGQKKTYRVVTKYGQVEVSSDHVFKTPDGSARIRDGLDYIMAMVPTSSKKDPIWPDFTAKELAKESWGVAFSGYEVSTLGRVRSYRTTRGFKSTPHQLQLVPNNMGRVVVNIGGKAHQVSHLVAKVFMGWNGELHILHKDDNPYNNRVTNLKVGDDKENCYDKRKNGGLRFLRESAVKVIHIEKCGVQDTFDISVTGNHWFCADNLIVHNSYNEMSARYAPLPDVNYRPEWEVLKQRGEAAEKSRNKQEKGTHPWDEQKAREWWANLPLLYLTLEGVYQEGLQAGVPKELARIVLPFARYSRMRAKANLRNWLAFMTLRFDPGAQWEIRQYAAIVGEIIQEKFPKTWALYVEKKSPEHRVKGIPDDVLLAEVVRRKIAGKLVFGEQAP